MSNRLKFWCALSLAILVINSALLWAFPVATTFTVANLLLHVGLGAALGVVALLMARREPRLGWTVVAAISGGVLAYMGNTRDHHSILLIHIVVSLLAVVVLFARRENFKFAGIAGVLAGLVLLGGIADRKWIRHPENEVVNPRRGAGLDGRGRRGTEQSVLSFRREYGGWQDCAVFVLHGIEEVRRMS